MEANNHNEVVFVGIYWINILYIYINIEQDPDFNLNCMHITFIIII